MNTAQLIILLLGAAFLILFFWLRSKGQENLQKTKDAISNQYGNGATPTCSIDGSTALLESILGNYNITVYEGNNTIVINGFPYKFEQILDFKLNDTESYKTSTSTVGAIGRAAVGGLAFGGVGAIIGASTAGKTTKRSGEYVFLITINDFKAPCQKFSTPHEHIANQVYSTLKIIVDRNTQKNNN